VIQVGGPLITASTFRIVAFPEYGAGHRGSSTAGTCKEPKGEILGQSDCLVPDVQS
jgi:hypothetical protein